MSPYIVRINEYCSLYNIDLDFIIELESVKLVKLSVIDDELWIDESQFRKVEQYIRWYYDLSINMEGIDVIDNLLSKIEKMQEEIKDLREKVKLIEND